MRKGKQFGEKQNHEHTKQVAQQSTLFSFLGKRTPTRSDEEFYGD